MQRVDGVVKSCPYIDHPSTHHVWALWGRLQDPYFHELINHILSSRSPNNRQVHPR